MGKVVYPTCEGNGASGAERIADMYRPGGRYYQPGMTVEIEHGKIHCYGSANPNSDAFGGTEKGYNVIVTTK